MIFKCTNLLRRVCTFDQREMPPHHVELRDGGPLSTEGFRNSKNILKCDGRLRQREEGRTSPRNEDQQNITMRQTADGEGSVEKREKGGERER